MFDLIGSDHKDGSITEFFAFTPSFQDGQPRAERQTYFNRMVGGELAIKMEADTLVTWIPFHLSVATSPDYWLGAFPGNENANYRQITNEVRAAATKPWGTWISGLYAHDLDSDGTFTFGSFTPRLGIPVSNIEFNRIAGEAAFGCRDGRRAAATCRRSPRALRRFSNPREPMAFGLLGISDRIAFAPCGGVHTTARQLR